MTTEEAKKPEPRPVDQDFENLKDRSQLHLSVLGSAPEEVAPFTLEGEGLHPPEGTVDFERVRRDVITALKTVYDPEIPLNIYDLGLIYEANVTEDGDTHVKMTLTAPGCPVAGSLVQEVHDKVRTVSGVRGAKTELVWDPPWTRDRMSEEAQLELGLL